MLSEVLGTVVNEQQYNLRFSNLQLIETHDDSGTSVGSAANSFSATTAAASESPGTTIGKPQRKPSFKKQKVQLIKERYNRQAMAHSIYYLECEAIEVLLSEFRHIGRPALSDDTSSLVTLTSDGKFTIASLCSDYVRTTWPRGGAMVLSAFTKMIEILSPISNAAHNPPFEKRIEESTSADSQEAMLELHFAYRFASVSSEVHFSGPSEIDAEVGAMCSWLACTFRMVRKQENPQVSAPSIPLLDITSPYSCLHIISCDGLRSMDPSVSGSSGLCWLSLLKGTPVAQGFTVPQRGELTTRSRDQMWTTLGLEVC